MPHLHIDNFNTIGFPSAIDGVNFDFIVKNINNTKEQLICTSINNESFFLLYKNEENRQLLKLDKLTRPSSLNSSHKALLSYAKIANLNILSSNVPETIENEHLKITKWIKDISYFANSFPAHDKIRIEVGFGSGRHLLYQAKKNPNILFIGIEIHKPSLEQVLKQINIQYIDNIFLLDYDARLFMELVPSNIVERIYVHFPVPWDKKPHRRVISTAFIEESRRVLNVNGCLELRTDSEKYHEYSYETFINFNSSILHINKNIDIPVSSKYEDRWKKMEKNIYDIIMTNKENSKENILKGEFVFGDINISKANLLELCGLSKKFDDYFIHFERIYSLDDGFMLRLSMGSFDRPEHIYLIIKESEVFYFPKLPLKSRSNLSAHIFLNGVLLG